MTRSLCASCGLRSRHCQCHQPLSTAADENSDDGERAFKLTPASSCVFYLIYTLLMFGIFFIMYMTTIYRDIIHPQCYLEVFADSFSISNASNATATATATADWNVGFTTRNPNECKVSLHTIKSGLHRGNKLISQSSSPDYFGLLVTGKINDLPLPYAVFKKVATPRNGVIWDLRVQVVSSVKIICRSVHGDGFLTVTCGDIPVNFTADPGGNMKGSLIGNMRSCEYVVHKEYLDKSF